MKKMKPYDRIEVVLKAAGRPLAAHEFDSVHFENEEGDVPTPVMRSGRQFVGYSEQTLARRLREMAVIGRVTAKTREGKNFKEYALVESAVPA